MDLRHLQALDAVLTTGSFTAAAAARHISQPALWVQIKNLEAELGFALFERSGRGVTPTLACLTLVPSLRTALSDVEVFQRRSREIREGSAAPARIGCAATFVSHFLAGCIKELRAKEPRIPFPVIVPITSRSAVETLAQGAVDLLVEPSQKPSRLDSLWLYDIELVVIGSHGDKKAVDVKSLDKRPIATLPTDSLVRRRLEDAARRAGVTLQIVYESRDAAALTALARSGVCDAVLHDEMLPQNIAARAPRLVAAKKPLRDALWLVWRSDGSLSPAAKALRDVMRGRSRRREFT